MPESEQVSAPIPTAEELSQSCIQTRERIEEFTRRANTIWVANPLSLIAIRRIDRERRALEGEFRDALISAYSISEAPLTAIGAIMSGLMARRAANSIMHVLALQSAWNDLGGTIDRKAAYAVALLSIYISIFSMNLSVMLFFLG